MTDRRVGILHVQSWTDPIKNLIKRQPVGGAKLLQGTVDPVLVRLILSLNPDAVFCYRHAFPAFTAGISDAEWDAHCDTAIRESEPIAFLGDRLYVELANNEDLQGGVDPNSPDLIRLDQLTQRGAVRFKKAGRRPVGFNTSVGNLVRVVGATVNGELIARGTEHARLIRGGVEALIEAGGLIEGHEYSWEGLPDDGWRMQRYLKLAADLAFYGLYPDWGIGEFGYDRGAVWGSPIGGYRFLPDKPDRSPKYAAFIDTHLRRYAADPKVKFVALFGAGAFKDFESFRYDGDDTVTAPLGRSYPVATPVAEPAPTPVAPPAPERTSPVKIGLMYRMGTDVPENSLEEMAATCDRTGASIICPKAADGDQMEGGFDADPVFAVKSIETLGALRDWFAAYRSEPNPRGIELHPWVTPRGFEPVAEGLLHARIAKLCGTVLVDFEDMYAGFWGAKLDGTPIFTSSAEGWAAAVLYFKTLRENSGGARIVLQNDHRQPLNRVYDMADLKPYVDAAAPQMYWPWFNESWNATLSEVTQINWQGWDLTATIYSSDSSHPADPTGTDECLTHLENVWYSRGPQPVYVFQRVGLTDELGAVLNKHSRLGGAVLVDVPGEPVQDGGRTFVAPADDPNGNAGKLIWTDDKGTFKVVDAPPPPPPPAVTILTPLPPGEGTAPAAPPVEVQPVPGPLEPIDFRAATYGVACSMIFQGIEQIRMLAADASSDDAANDRATCDRISRDMQAIKERHGVRP